jgi:thioredoxin reductase (NADPH)
VSQEARSANNGARSLSLQSSIPGVFAVGDARSGSVKRVGAAIGEGVGVVAQLHAYLNYVSDALKKVINDMDGAKEEART